MGKNRIVSLKGVPGKGLNCEWSILFVLGGVLNGGSIVFAYKLAYF